MIDNLWKMIKFSKNKNNLLIKYKRKLKPQAIKSSKNPKTIKILMKNPKIIRLQNTNLKTC